MGFVSISDCMVSGDPEFDALLADYQHVWLVLCAWPSLTRRCGIFKRAGAIAALGSKTHRGAELVESAFIEYERLGWLIREGEYVWAVNKIKYSDSSPKWYSAALHEADGLCLQTPLAKACIRRYDPDGSKIRPHIYQHYGAHSQPSPDGLPDRELNLSPSEMVAAIAELKKVKR